MEVFELKVLYIMITLSKKKVNWSDLNIIGNNRDNSPKNYGIQIRGILSEKTNPVKKSW